MGILILILGILAIIGGVVLLRRYSAGLGIALIVVGALVLLYALFGAGALSADIG